ncbi:MAG TPA: hypothetical protein VGK99_24435 [Acidobacteriota bacterium]
MNIFKKTRISEAAKINEHSSEIDGWVFLAKFFKAVQVHVHEHVNVYGYVLVQIVGDS